MCYWTWYLLLQKLTKPAAHAPVPKVLHTFMFSRGLHGSQSFAWSILLSTKRTWMCVHLLFGPGCQSSSSTRAALGNTSASVDSCMCCWYCTYWGDCSVDGWYPIRIVSSFVSQLSWSSSVAFANLTECGWVMDALKFSTIGFNMQKVAILLVNSQLCCSWNHLKWFILK